MKSLKILRNNGGTITVFFIIVTGVILWGFFLMSSLYSLKIGENAAVNYLEASNNMLLSSPDEYILKNYNLACYYNEDAEERVYEIIKENCLINYEGSKFYKMDTDRDYIEYSSAGDITDINELKKQIVKYSSYQSAEEFTKWILEKINKTKEVEKMREKFSNKVNLSEKISKIYDYKKEFQNKIYEISKKHSKKIGKIEELMDEDLEEMYSKVKSLKNENEEALETLEKMKKAMLEKADEDERMDELPIDLNFSYENELEEVEIYTDKLKKNITLLSKLKHEINKSKFKNLNFDIEDYFDDYQLLGEIERDDEENVGKEIVKELWNEIKNLKGSSLAKSSYEFSDYDDIEFSISENFLINEYILSTFQKNVDVDIRDFSGKYRDERESVFPEREVEYILTGIQGENFSKTNVTGRIFLIRQGMNIIHILTTPEKMKVIEEIGELSSSVFLPAGPVAMILVINGWSALESIKDIKLLYDGKGVPLIKSDKEWLTDIDIGNRKIINKNINFEKYGESDFDEFYYNDYLRLLLFFSKGEIKLSRILDVIEENYSDKSLDDVNLSNYSVSHEIKAWYDIEPMFSNKEFYRTFEVNGGY